MHENLPPHILLVLDWAYAEYLEDGFSDAAARMVEEHNNVVMTHQIRMDMFEEATLLAIDDYFTKSTKSGGTKRAGTA